MYQVDRENLYGASFIFSSYFGGERRADGSKKQERERESEREAENKERERRKKER